MLQWIPELGVADTETMEPIQGLEAIGKDRWNLNCTVCKQRVGAKVQCSKCYTAFHPLCGRLRGFTMDMLENAGGPHLPLVTVLHCHKHCTPRPGAFGVRLLCAPLPQVSHRSPAVCILMSTGRARPAAAAPRMHACGRFERGPRRLEQCADHVEARAAGSQEQRRRSAAHAASRRS